MRPTASRTLASCIAVLLLLLFGTPLRVLWSHPAAPWWLIFALWGAAILGLYAASRDGRAGRRER
ncbi:MAG: hypothetical protein ABW352_04855 [Polyangiales bacterium]